MYGIWKQATIKILKDCSKVNVDALTKVDVGALTHLSVSVSITVNTVVSYPEA